MYTVKPENEIKEALIAVIEGAYREAGYTQRSLSEKVGISYNTYRRYLSGERDFTVPGFFTFCEATGFTPNQIINRIQNRLLSEAPTNVTNIRSKQDLFPGDSADRYTGPKAANTTEEDPLDPDI